MVHISTVELHVTKGTGIFFCPNCHEKRPYQLRALRKFLALYWVPLIPLDEKSRHVRCRICKDQFPVGVLTGDVRTSRRAGPPVRVQRAVVLAAMRLAMVDGTPTRATLAELQKLIRARAGVQASHDEIFRMGRLVSDELGWDTADHLASGGVISPPQLEQAVRDLFLVASADGEMKPRQLAELADLPHKLGLRESRFRRLIHDTVTGPAAGPAIVT